MPQFLGFISGSYQSQSVVTDAEKTLNFYPERVESKRETRFVLYPCPGFQTLATSPEITGRALLSISETGRTFGIQGPTLYEISSTGTLTNRGTVAQDSNKATISYNGPTGNQLGITSGTNWYVFNLATNTLTQIAAMNGKATMGAMIDGYGLIFDIATGRVQVTALNDFSTIDPTVFFQRSLRPDPWQAMVVGPDFRLWMIGAETSEVWYDAGTFPVPFAPITNNVIPYGTPAPWSVVKSDDRISWISHSDLGQAIIVSGPAVQRISNHAVEFVLSNYARSSTITDAEAFSYQDQGHTFIGWLFPSAMGAWFFDPLTSLWHERDKHNWTTGQSGLYAPRCHCHAFGKHIVSDWSTGVISVMDVTFGAEHDGTGILRLRRSPGVIEEMRAIPFSQFEVLLESGLGLQSGQGSDPQVMFRVSGDGGHTFGNIRTAGAGKVGQYRKRVQFKRLGVLRDAVFEISMTDPIPWRVIDAYLNNTEDRVAA